MNVFLGPAAEALRRDVGDWTADEAEEAARIAITSLLENPATLIAAMQAKCVVTDHPDKVCSPPIRKHPECVIAAIKRAVLEGAKT